MRPSWLVAVAVQGSLFAVISFFLDTLEGLYEQISFFIFASQRKCWACELVCLRLDSFVNHPTLNSKVSL